MGWLDSLFGGNREIRDPEFSGVQYAGDEGELRDRLEQLLEGADASRPEGALRGIVSPFGDYDYAGPIMADAYAPLRELAAEPSRVLMMASSTRVPFRGVAVAGWDALETPVGEVPVDLDAVEAAVDAELARPVPAAFEPAAGIELQLPFLRSTLPDVPCMPALVGDADDETVVAFLDEFWDEATLLVIGANLSEGFEAERARACDAETVDALESSDPSGIQRAYTTARRPLRALVIAAERRGMRIRRGRMATSAETAGSAEKVVGYASLFVVR